MNIARDYNTDNIIQFTAKTRIDVLTVVDSQAAMLPYIDDVLLNGLNITSAYYLQAFGVDSIQDATVMRTLDRLNPDRDLAEAAATSRYTNLDASCMSFNLLADGGDFVADPEVALRNNSGIAGVGGKDMYGESANLSVGKLIHVKAKVEGDLREIPMNVRLLSHMVPSNDMTQLLGVSSYDKNLYERYHQWRSGRINFWEEFVFCEDLIQERRRRIIADKTGIEATRRARESNNRIATILSGRPSVAQASALQVMVHDTSKDIERKARFKFDNFIQREEYFSENLAMMAMVIDPQAAVVRIYYKSIPDPTVVSIKAMQKLNKTKSGPDMLEVLNSLRDTTPPNF